MGKPGRRRKQLLNDLQETRRYWKLKEEYLLPLFGGFAFEETMDLL
jgi:hypothetical protein